jgi:hypothetical protein
MSTDSAAIVAFKEGGEPGRNRTCDPLLRRQMLYPTELRALELDCSSARFTEKVREQSHINHMENQAVRPTRAPNRSLQEQSHINHDSMLPGGLERRMENQAVRPTRAPNRMLQEQSHINHDSMLPGVWSKEWKTRR